MCREEMIQEGEPGQWLWERRKMRSKDYHEQEPRIHNHLNVGIRQKETGMSPQVSGLGDLEIKEPFSKTEKIGEADWGRRQE